MESLSTPSESFNAAPYGGACAACSRAKCKCFYRSDGPGCERCHRLGKVCEPSMTTRKRNPRKRRPPPARLEERLDQLISLLHSRDASQQAQTPSQRAQSAFDERDTPSTLSTVSVMTPAPNPDVAIDTSAGVVHLLRPANVMSDSVSLSPILDDISVHDIHGVMAEDQLGIFRRWFLTNFPVVYIPPTVSASELRHQKPFLWLVIMTLTTKFVPQQFAMEETIWKIISRRVITQHYADLDILLGIICFASWSHYFKQDKPFMTMLAQMAVSLAYELDLHKEAPINTSRRYKQNGISTQEPSNKYLRTMEERRTFLALFHLTSSTWSTYRKTQPLCWTPYMNDCVRILGENIETQQDILLIAQVKCQDIINQLTCPSPDEYTVGESSRAISSILCAAMLKQLGDIRQSLPPQIQSDMILQLYLCTTEMIIKEKFLSKPRPRDQTGLSHFQRIQDIDSVLTIVERWLALFSEVPLMNWLGISVDSFFQFSHTLVVLFKLTTLEEPGWDLVEVRRRADVFEIIDRGCDMLIHVRELVGMVDAEGPRSGLFFKAPILFRALKALFMAELAPEMLGITQISDRHEADAPSKFMEEQSISDDVIKSLVNEPWLSDMFMPSWDFGMDRHDGFGSSQAFDEWVA